MFKDSNTLGSIWGGHRIIESPTMVEDGEPITVKRSWYARLFTLPWRPWKSTEVIIPKVPMKEAFRLPNGDLIMHPEMARKLKEAIEKQC